MPGSAKPVGGLGRARTLSPYSRNAGESWDSSEAGRVDTAGGSWHGAGMLSATEHYPIRSYEVDSGARLTVPALCNYLQESAGLHAGPE